MRVCQGGIRAEISLSLEDILKQKKGTGVWGVPSDAGQHSRAQFSETNMGRDIIGHNAEGQVFLGFFWTYEDLEKRQGPKDNPDFRNSLTCYLSLSHLQM